MLRNLTQRRFQSTLASNTSNGIKGLFSSTGYNTAYVSRLEHHSSSLRDILQAKNYANQASTEQYAKDHATDAMNKGLFQHASSLYNLQFSYARLGENRDTKAGISKSSADALFETPKENKDITNPPTGRLLKLIESNFGSLEEFKTLLLQSANAINGDGYTWLITRSVPESINLNAAYKLEDLSIVNTYNAGSPRNFSASQITKFANQIQSEETESKTEERSSTILPLNRIEEFSALKDNIIPLLALDASPKAYLADYGVYGKTQYLENLWNSVDWDIVENDLKTLTDSKVSSFK